MLEQAVRGVYQKVFVDPVVRCMASHITPLHVTGVAVVLGLLFVPCLLTGQTGLAVLFLLLSGYCDTVDGSLARYQHSDTPVGCVLDIMADRLVEFVVIFGLYAVDPVHRGGLSLWMLGSVLLCVSSFLMVAVFTPNESMKSCHYSAGLIERAEAFLFFIAMTLLPQWFVVLSVLFIVLVLFTAGLRLKQFVRQQLLGSV